MTDKWGNPIDDESAWKLRKRCKDLAREILRRKRIRFFSVDELTQDLCFHFLLARELEPPANWITTKAYDLIALRMRGAEWSRKQRLDEAHEAIVDPAPRAIDLLIRRERQEQFLQWLKRQPPSLQTFYWSYVHGTLTKPLSPRERVAKHRLFAAIGDFNEECP